MTIIDERPYRGITIQAGDHVIHAEDLDEKTMALAAKLEASAAEQKESRQPR